jgi:hypothetical protein
VGEAIVTLLGRCRERTAANCDRAITTLLTPRAQLGTPRQGHEYLAPPGRAGRSRRTGTGNHQRRRRLKAGPAAGNESARHARHTRHSAPAQPVALCGEGDKRGDRLRSGHHAGCTCGIPRGAVPAPKRTRQAQRAVMRVMRTPHDGACLDPRLLSCPCDLDFRTHTGRGFS